jgi:hypothetical protein
MIAMMSFIDGRPSVPIVPAPTQIVRRNAFVHPLRKQGWSDGIRNYARCHILRQKEFRRRPLAALDCGAVRGAELVAVFLLGQNRLLVKEVIPI